MTQCRTPRARVCSNHRKQSHDGPLVSRDVLAIANTCAFSSYAHLVNTQAHPVVHEESFDRRACAISAYAMSEPPGTGAAEYSGPAVRPLGVSPLADLDGDRPRHVDALLHRWLIVVRNHPLAIHVSVALALILAADVSFLAARSPFPSLLESVGVELLIILIAVAIPVALTVAALRQEFATIFSLVASGPAPAAPLLLRFVGEELNKFDEFVGDLCSQGALIDQGEVADWLRRRCFVVTDGRYLATDSCVPSVFINQYTILMKAHAEYLERTKRLDSIRINTAKLSMLAADHKQHPDAFAKYVDWHKAHNVTLLHLDSDDARELATANRLGDIIDWSLWLGEAVIAWEYIEAGLRLRLSFVGDYSYRRCYNLMRDILAHERTQMLDSDFVTMLASLPA